MDSLDHIGIAVASLEEGLTSFVEKLRFHHEEIEEVPTEKVRVAIFGHGLGRVELVCPTDPESPLARRIQEKGEGLHHVCLAVPDIQKAMDALQAGGAPLLDKVPRTGAGGSRVAFVHPRGSRGVLVELKQS